MFNTLLDSAALRVLLAAFGLPLTVGMCNLGCASAEREAQIAAFKEVSLFAKEHGFAGQANLEIGGQPSFDLRSGGVFDTGLRGNLSIQFNSLAQPRGKAETSVGDAVMIRTNETANKEDDEALPNPDAS